MDGRAGSRIKTLLQIVAVLGMILLLGMILHKAFGDISVLAGEHSGEKFWQALGRYLLRNLGGGG